MDREILSTGRTALLAAALLAACGGGEPPEDVCRAGACRGDAADDGARPDAPARDGSGRDVAPPGEDAAVDDAAGPDGGDAGLDAPWDTGPDVPADAGRDAPWDAGIDAARDAPADAAVETGSDAGAGDAGAGDAGASGPITGGPCVSGAPGATAFRVRWVNSGGRATVDYEVHGLPDRSRWRVGAYSMSFGYTPAYTDTFLAEGGLQLDSGKFVDVELSTVGLRAISRVTLSIYGRSFSTTTSGSFTWQTFVATGATPRDTVSNATPYRWYGGDATLAFRPGDGGALLRIRPGPSSGSLVVNRIELCMEAD